MEWQKAWRKQKIEWSREDVKFYSECYNNYVKLFKQHCCKKHNGQYDEKCERCGLWKELILATRENIRSSKREIREVLRGER